jgi:hypothetical protein
MMEEFLNLLAAIEDAGGLKEVKTEDGLTPQLKLICDKQTYNVIISTLSGILQSVSDTKSKGLCFTIEIGALD